MIGWPILSLTIFVPLVGAGFIFLIRGEDAVVARNARNVALWTSLITLVLALMVWAEFDPSTSAFQLEERASWIPAFNITYHLGVDGISVFFVLLSAFLTPLCVLASWTTITQRVKEYMIAFLVLETLLIGMFAALDIVLFYLFFEGVLIPMFLIIGIWGG
ncbi:MAG: NADH-quinone oxidoreductase subunit M, partial [Alphaproteobacteria bacterium]